VIDAGFLNVSSNRKKTRRKKGGCHLREGKREPVCFDSPARRREKQVVEAGTNAPPLGAKEKKKKRKGGTRLWANDRA